MDVNGLIGTPIVPVTRDRLYEQVAQQIQVLIVANQWSVGDKLPSERVLGEQFGVSRTVIREALKALSERGLVTIRPGRGIFVADPSSTTLKEPMRLLFQRHNISHENLIEARRTLEIEIAGLAAERALPEQIEKMRVAIEEMDRSIDDPDSFTEGDAGFHLALAEATQNKMFTMLIESVADLVYEGLGLTFMVKGSPSRGQHYHRAILNAVERHYPEAARRAMMEHLAQADRDLHRAVTADPLES